MPIENREYQSDAINRLQQKAREGKRRLILQAETGSGKTVMAARMIERSLDLGKRVLFIAPQRQLVYQCSEKLYDAGIYKHGIIMREEEFTPAPVQVASRDTLYARAIRSKRMTLPPADVVYVDECHVANKMLEKILAAYPDAFKIGLTATPAKGDGSGMGDWYDDMVQAIPNSDLIKLGYKVPSRVFAPTMPDLKGVPKNADGDYRPEPLGKRMMETVLVGDVVENWIRLSERRRTIVFCASVAHAIFVRDKFRRAGVAAEYVEGGTETEDRQRIFKGLKDGTIEVLVNCMVTTFGFDAPWVSCLVFLRPTKSFVLYRQMIGRGGRPCPTLGKTDCLMIDHAGLVYEHGMPDDDIEWELSPSTRVQEKRKRDREGSPDKEPIVCPKCFAAFSGRNRCPNCGNALEKKGKHLETKRGELVEVGRTGQRRDFPKEEKQRYWRYCLGVCAAKGRKAGAAAHMYRQRFGIWPRMLTPMPEGGEWSMPVSVLYPGFVRSAARATQPVCDGPERPPEPHPEGQVRDGPVPGPRGHEEQPQPVAERERQLDRQMPLWVQ